MAAGTLRYWLRRVSCPSLDVPMETAREGRGRRWGPGKGGIYGRDAALTLVQGGVGGRRLVVFWPMGRRLRQRGALGRGAIVTRGGSTGNRSKSPMRDRRRIVQGIHGRGAGVGLIRAAWIVGGGVGNCGDVDRVHCRGCGTRLGRDAGELPVEAAATGLRLVALDPSSSARATCLSDSSCAWRRRGAAALLGRVVFMIDNVSSQEILSRKRFLAYFADEAAAQSVRLNVPYQMLGPRVGASAVTARVQVAPRMAPGRRRRRGTLAV